MLTEFISALGLAFSMAWQVAWSLVLGFLLSGLIQAVISQEKIREQLGYDGFRSIALAAGYGAASSSCSYASAAITKKLIVQGAAFIPSLAFLFASTNLVIELGIVLWQLMGWQFALAEWIGGIVLILIMSTLVRLTYPNKLVDQARHTAQSVFLGHEHSSRVASGQNIWQRLRAPETYIIVAQSVARDWEMLRGDVLLGFFIAGFLATTIPNQNWHHLFLNAAHPLLGHDVDVIEVLIAPFIAVISFVCSIGNVPLAAALWSDGMGFGGILAFLYADLIVLPLLDVYRKSYGWKMAAYIGLIFYITMALSGWLVGKMFTAWHLTPAHRAMPRTTFALAFDATFFLNVMAFIAVVAVIWINRAHPMEHACHRATHSGEVVSHE